MSSSKLRLLECILEKGSSNWLTALPIKESGFYLDKSTWWDAIYLRYGFAMKRLPSYCNCGKAFSVEHAMLCMKGGYVTMRHNELRDITAELLEEVCKDVQTEPKLAELTGEKFKLRSTNTENEARLDIACRGFWSTGTRALLDIRVFNPLAKSYLDKSVTEAHRANEQQKKRTYNQRVIEVEHSSFTPLIFSCFGGMSKECTTFYKHLSELLAEKRDEPYYKISNYIRTRMSFSLIRVAIICIRGWRGKLKEDYSKIVELDIPSVIDDAKIDNQ